MNSLQQPLVEAELRALLARGITLVRRLVDIPRLQVRLPRSVYPDWPAGLVGESADPAPQGTHPAQLNNYGAVSVLTGGTHLGVKPGEFHFVCPFVDGDTSLVKPLRSITAPAPKFGTSRWMVSARAPGLVTSARLEHLHDVTEDDMICEGAAIARRHESHAGMTGRGPLIDGLAHAWNLLAPEGSKWGDDPWTWRIQLHEENGT